MRTPKKGDKCEHAWWDPVRSTNVRDCPVRHMDGKPPGQLVARVKDKRTILVCLKHAVDFMAPNVRKQKKRAEVAEQVDLVAVAQLVSDSLLLDTQIAKEMCAHFDAMYEAGMLKAVKPVTVRPNLNAKSEKDLFGDVPHEMALGKYAEFIAPPCVGNETRLHKGPLTAQNGLQQIGLDHQAVFERAVMRTISEMPEGI